MHHIISNNGHCNEMLAAVYQQMHDTSIVSEAEDRLEGISLSNIPWKLRCIGEISGNHISDKSSGSPQGPSWNYIDIRRTQNIQWAKNQLTQGIVFAKAGRDKEAEECYKNGLDFVPEYVELLVAYGALCANQGRLEEGIAKLEKATEIDAQSPNAQSYLDAIRRRQIEAATIKKTPTTLSRSDKAVQDAMAEQAFLTGASTKIKIDHKSCDSYPLVYEETIEESDCDLALDREKRKHRKPKEMLSKKKKKKRKRNRYDDSDSANDASEDSSTRRERKRRKKKRRKRRREQCSSESEEETSRRHRRRDLLTSQGKVPNLQKLVR